VNTINKYTTVNSSFFSIYGVSVLLFLLLFNYNLIYSVAILIFLHQAFSFYFSLGKQVSIRKLMGMMYSLNYLFSPVLMYTWLNPYTNENFTMKGDPNVYFSYAIPCVLLFLFAINYGIKKEEDNLNTDTLSKIAIQLPKLPIRLALIGLLSRIVSPFCPTEVQMLLNTFSYLGFAGLFLSLFNGKKASVLLFVLTYGVLIVESLMSSMFNDLLNMLFFLGFFLCIRYRPSNLVKISGLVIGILIVIFIQNIKFTLREQVTNSISDIQNLGNVIQESNEKRAGEVFGEKASDVVARLDQGWVTSGTIQNYSTNGFQLQNGRHALLLLESSILPRILVPDKLTVGDRTAFNKYSGHYIAAGTSIPLGVLSDGFIDFGYNGWIAVLLFGLLIRYGISYYHKLDRKFYLAKVFAPLCFYYVVKADTDTHSALGTLFKATLIIYLILFYLNKKFPTNLKTNLAATV
jgi:hypothetical protein